MLAMSLPSMSEEVYNKKASETLLDIEMDSYEAVFNCDFIIRFLIRFARVQVKKLLTPIGLEMNIIINILFNEETYICI